MRYSSPGNKSYFKAQVDEIERETSTIQKYGTTGNMSQIPITKGSNRAQVVLRVSPDENNYNGRFTLKGQLLKSTGCFFKPKGAFLIAGKRRQSEDREKYQIDDN